MATPKQLLGSRGERLLSKCCHCPKCKRAKTFKLLPALESAIRELRPSATGGSKAGPCLAQSLTELGLIDEYRIYLHPVVLGHGSPYFAGPRPQLRLTTCERFDED